MLKTCKNIVRKIRSDKGEDRLNTSSKYAIYFFLGLLVASIYFTLNPKIEIRTRYIEPVNEIVCSPEKVVEYVYSGCEPLTK